MKGRYFISLCYDGTNYHGWQLQTNAHSVQADLNNALAIVFRKNIETLGAGRTDTGVHAKEFFAHFDHEGPLPDRVVHSLNSILPHDIAIAGIYRVTDNAHARYDALSRTYEYHLYTEKNPFLRGRAGYFPFRFSMDTMNKASEMLKEYSDFGSFSKSRTDVKTNICKIMHAEWKEAAGRIIFEVRADRFLRGMVRALVGTITEAGKGKMTLEEFRKIIEGKKRSDAGESVDPCGLYLTKVEYPQNIFIS